MTQLQAAILSSRLVCAWLLYCAMNDLMGVLKNSITLFSGIYSILDGVTASKMQKSLLLGNAQFLFEFAIDIGFAIFFYRCGPRLLRFLLGPKEHPVQHEDPAATI